MPRTIEDYENAKRLRSKLRQLEKQQARTIESVNNRYAAKRLEILTEAGPVAHAILRDTLDQQTSGTASSSPTQTHVADEQSEPPPGATGPENGTTSSPRLLAPVEPLPPGAIVEIDEKPKRGRMTGAGRVEG